MNQTTILMCVTILLLLFVVSTAIFEHNKQTSIVSHTITTNNNKNRPFHVPFDFFSGPLFSTIIS